MRKSGQSCDMLPGSHACCPECAGWRLKRPSGKHERDQPTFVWPYRLIPGSVSSKIKNRLYEGAPHGRVELADSEHVVAGFFSDFA